MQALTASCEELRAWTGKPPLNAHFVKKLHKNQVKFSFLYVVYTKTFRRVDYSLIDNLASLTNC